MKLADLAVHLKAELRGDATTEVSGVSSLDDVRVGTLTYVADAPRLAQAAASAASVLLVPLKLAQHEALAARTLLIARDAKLAFARAIQLFYEKPYVARGVSAELIMDDGSRYGVDCSIHPRVTIGANSIIGNRVTLHPGVVIGDHCRIGDDTVIFPNVTIYDDSDIGARCRLHSGTVIGADGFSFTPDEAGHQFKLLQIGRVVIEDDVEIGSNCSIDRAGFGETRIKRGAKFDNLIQLGHNCVIGEDTVVASQAGFSGGTQVGTRCIIAGQIGTNQHITIGDGAIVTARAGVTKSVPAGKMVGGVIPAMDYQEWRKSQVIYARLPEVYERLKKLERDYAADDKNAD
ncbi:MAG: UDP-3-O-(3-hydroxymyristoyl)glucosamine N-acyltransferase, partial [Acidobacteria bacterium]|nr:UDP-3-O-(3-hydroxymyristoyl)glucosamine N-acyltransferase [Acidobacteriota bacterium]